MTEPADPLATDPPAAAIEPPAEVPLPQPPVEQPLGRPARDTLLPWLCLLGFLVLAGAIGLVWWSFQQPASQPVADLAALQDRVARLEQRPVPAAAGPVDLGPLTARVAALEQRTAPDLSPLEARVAALEKQVADNSPFAARLDALSGRVDALSGRDQGAVSDLGRRLDADEARLATLERTTAQMTAAAQQTARLARIQAAEAALAAGQMLGDLPNAPPAVARFAAANPPTEASLRLAYPAAEHAALAASHPDADEKPLLARALAYAGDLVTVRQGDRVLLGDPAAGVLARARTALAAGDLGDAVAAVSSLSGPPAAAMAAWLADAKAVLAARAALAAMAAHA
ncbi:MAG: mitofilin family membrane protein [Acetobacteraceae bacterium]|jgi:hypothetical protein